MQRIFCHNQECSHQNKIDDTCELSEINLWGSGICGDRDVDAVKRAELDRSEDVDEVEE